MGGGTLQGNRIELSNEKREIGEKGLALFYGLVFCPLMFGVGAVTEISPGATA